MTTTIDRSSGDTISVTPPSPTVERLATVGDLGKFTGMVALFAILSDAAVGHALLWENDPYWTYWVTKTS